MSRPAIHPALFEALAAYENYRRLGFTPDEIFFRSQPEGPIHMTVQRNGLEFNARCGEHQLPTDEIVKQWQTAVDWWKNGTETERREMYESSFMRRNVVGMIVALREKGFAVKRSDA